MDYKVYPAPLGGTIAAIPSKSDVHRLLICAALSDKRTEIFCPAVSEDITATARCLTALGAEIQYSGGVFSVLPIREVPENPTLDCGESGSTLRFMLPVAAAICERASFIGRGRLPERPIGDLRTAMEAHGAHFSADRLPFAVSGGLSGGAFSLPGNVSSQYITGLLLALPTVGGGEVRLTTPLQSASYVEMTKRAMGKFGVNVNGLAVSGSYRSPGAVIAEGDWSNAAFFIIAGASVTGLDPASPQGDRVIFENLARLDRGECVDLTDTPDMLPALAVYAAMHRGGSFTGIERLRIKESDRIMTVKNMINSLGGAARDHGERFTVEPQPLTGGRCDSASDHRIAMAAAIGASLGTHTSVICGGECVNKSYPGFWEDFRLLGGRFDVL
ncbi:MAG: 3-phosphoshikimate 1-carboxyvinyltransferase [Oscillospiraceae bacterium]|nr:3-phosphoshikimate 1-carboxyvinyltransferase [Oscillospiraceae bacterium]